MKMLLLIPVIVAAAACARSQETRSVVSSPATAKDSLANSMAVPEALSVPVTLQRTVIVRLKYGADLLQGLEDAVRQGRIHNAVILAGIGSVRNYRFHVVSSRTLPTVNTFVQNPTMPADLAAMNGYVIDGRVHAHVTFSTADSAFGGHLEKGTNVYTFAIITLGVLGDDADLSRVDDTAFR